MAGSDTTATVLSGLFYYILRDPKEYDCLQKEVDFFFPPGDGSPFDSLLLADMPHLNAVM